ncbi:MAG TPA: LemA family protein [Bacteroidales bacterium]|nr:MAG: LemA family protein [Bacteroidetes bacterium GWF2_33_38]OFY76182.1 MAG: LemA family protein [Bacteroidetes bacterium RIFOXYA12_FULL_33_9]OFY90536.1 MAG: LemA family protein [Bacteroidetes bacterium RIFOXYA2_FULL_33_7]HBF88116.1 LemA family protein [Bacteroidales bacterium]
MKKSWIIIIVIVLMLLWLGFSAQSSYNSMVEKNESVSNQWAQVENVYQRRADLIPNLVNTVKGYAEHEKSTFTAVIEARSKATAVNIDANNLDAASFQKFQEAQDGLSSALSKLMVVMERYPDLKANQNFLELQAQLEGTENRITVERMKFNDVSKDYNTYIKKFPKNLWASMFNFEAKEYFKAQEGAEKAPEVKF